MNGRDTPIDSATQSRQISNFETTLEVTLFTRGARDMVLTDSGIALLDYMRQIGDAATQISRVARDFSVFRKF